VATSYGGERALGSCKQEKGTRDPMASTEGSSARRPAAGRRMGTGRRRPTRRVAVQRRGVAVVVRGRAVQRGIVGEVVHAPAG
jgi:hypothetical protein